MKRIILFDGECTFCNANVQFIIKRDPYAYFNFTSIQSDIGQEFIQKHEIPPEIDSVILIEGDKAYTRSSAALRIAKKLDGLWHLLYVFMLVPRSIRDGVYDIVARNRLKLVGKNEEACMLPSPEVRNRFL